MRRGQTDQEFPVFPIGPILEAFGGQPVVEGIGWKPYRCPFHDDRDASASVNTVKQVFNCHAADCPKGSAVQVLMQHERIPYREALQRAEELSGASVGNVRSASGRGRGLARGPRDQSGGRGKKWTRRRP